jgi:DNA gyrase subunit B
MIAALGCGIGAEDFDLAKLRYHRIIIMTDADVDGSHIRTLLLTFFYRQLPELIEKGYVYIAQPPLFRVKRGKGETYIKDERDLENYLIKRACESRTVKLLDRGTEYSGADLERLLQKLMAFNKYLQVVERRGYTFDIVKRLLVRDAKDNAFFSNKDALEEVARAMTSATRAATVQRDEEHNSYGLAIEDRSGSYTRHLSITVDFVTTGEYRTLLASFDRDIRGLEGPMLVTTGEGGSREDIAADPAEVAAEPKAEPPAPQSKDGAVRVGSREELLEFFIGAGKRGVAINRYKGLGEMNPDQLWTTTMKPENRTLLQVRAEDHTEADLMFTTLMGDQVEPRRKFIEENALDVKNLDV